MATLGLSKLISDIQAKYNNAVSTANLHLKSEGGTIVDVSKNAATITLQGNTTTSTTQTKYQSHSIFFDGTGDYLTVPASTELFDFSGDYTVEAWVYKSGNGANAFDGLFSYGSGPSATDGIYFECSSSRGVAVIANGSLIVSDSVSPNTNAWRHIAITRQGNTTRIFQDGSETISSTTVYTVPTSASIAQVGRVESLYTFSGYMEDVRVTCGTALYTSNFTPPTETLPIVEASEALTNLYNLTNKVSSGYKVNQLPPAASKQFGSILRVDDTYYATNGSDWNTISLADSDYVNYIFQGTTAGHFVASSVAGDYDVLTFSNDTPVAGTIPSNYDDGGRTGSNAGFSDVTGNVGYTSPGGTTPLAKIDYATNTSTVVSPYTITTPFDANSGSNTTDVNAREGYFARTTTVPTTTVTMDKISFSSLGTATVNVGSLTVPTFGWSQSGCPSTTHGFTYGGFAPGGPIVFDEIHKFPFASVTTLASTFLLNAAKGRQAGTASPEAGYSIYGREAGPTGTAQNFSYRFPFATDVSSAINTPLGGKLNAASATSETAAYIYGGNAQEFPGTVRSNTVHKIPYASEASSTDLGLLASPIPASPSTVYWQGVQG